MTRPRLTAEHRDQQTLLTEWRFMRELFPEMTPAAIRDHLAYQRINNRTTAAVARDRQRDDLKCWLTRHGWRLGGTVVQMYWLQQSWNKVARGRRSAMLAPNGFYGTGYGFDEAAMRIAADVADGWAEAAVEAVMKECGQ